MVPLYARLFHDYALVSIVPKWSPLQQSEKILQKNVALVTISTKKKYIYLFIIKTNFIGTIFQATSDDEI
jgi:hypothetical protein